MSKEENLLSSDESPIPVVAGKSGVTRSEEWEEGLIGVRVSLWHEHFHHNRFLATNMMPLDAELEGDARQRTVT